MFLAAVVQLNSGRDGEANWAGVRSLIACAADKGAQLVATPENTNFMGPPSEKVELAEDLKRFLEDKPIQARFS